VELPELYRRLWSYSKIRILFPEDNIQDFQDINKQVSHFKTERDIFKGQVNDKAQFLCVINPNVPGQHLRN
jgi:hypothetical protein